MLHDTLLRSVMFLALTLSAQGCASGPPHCTGPLQRINPPQAASMPGAVGAMPNGRRP